MTLCAAIALLGLHLVHTDLLALAVLHDARGDGSTLEDGRAELAARFVDHGENLIESDVLSGLNAQLLNKEDVSLGNTVLLAAGYDDRIFDLPVAPAFLFADSLLGREDIAQLKALSMRLDKFTIRELPCQLFFLEKSSFFVYNDTLTLRV